jgi:predicted small secreted protein
MRILFAIPAVLVLGACNVTKDGNAVTVQYDQNTAENTAAVVGNTAQNIAADIGNDVQKSGEKVENKVGNTDVNVKIGNDVKTENKTTTTTTTEKKK